MHPAALENFKREWIAAAPRPNGVWNGLRVLDMGGQDVNGTVHGFIAAGLGDGLELHVLDVEAGRGVTHVGDARNTDWWDGQPYDVVISTEMLEHLEGWKQSFDTAFTVLRPGGWFIGTCAGMGRQRHGATGAPLPAEGEYYENVQADHMIQEFLNLPSPWWDRVWVGYEMNGAPTTHDLHWRARKAS